MGETTGKTTKTIGTDAKSGGRQKPAAPSGATEIELLRFDLLHSALYHDMRQTSLSRIHKGSLFATVVLGSAAIAAFGANYPLAGQLSGAAIAIISAASLIWSFGDAAKDHSQLRANFYSLLADLHQKATADDVRARMVLIYAEEPPVVHRVSKRAHDRAGRSVFGDDFNRA